MELAEQSVSDLFLAKGEMSLGLDHEVSDTALNHTIHTEVKDITVQIIGLEGRKLEIPILSEAIIEPISPAEVTLEESTLLETTQEATEEETTSSDDPEVHLTQSDHASSDPVVPNEITEANNSALDLNPLQTSSELVAHIDQSEAAMGPTDMAALEPDALLDPSDLAKEAACKNGFSECSASNTVSSRDNGGFKEDKNVRKNIPSKKNRMDPLKMDMSKPTIIPLTSSQLSLQCLECHIIFSDNKSKERHLKINHPTEYEQYILRDSFFACYVCDKHFTSSTELMAHQRTHTEKQPFKCPICEEAFCRSSELTNHKKVHFGKHGYTCSECSKHCKTLTLLKYHQRIHTGERPYVCIHKECGKRFSTTKAFKKHLEAHEKEETGGTQESANGTTITKKRKRKGTLTKKFACSQCEESFKTAKSQLLHIKSKHCQSKTITSSNRTQAEQELNGNMPTTTHSATLQPPVLLMEALGPAHQQIGPLGAEQIKKLIEKLGNVQKVNQLIILGQTQTMRMQPLHFNFTEPTIQPDAVQETGNQPVHEGIVSDGTEKTTHKESVDIGEAVNHEETMIQEERTIVSAVNIEDQVVTVETDMSGAQINESQTECVAELTEKSVLTSPLEISQEHRAEEQSIHITDVNTVETGDCTFLISTNDDKSRQAQTVEDEHVPKDIMATDETINQEELIGGKPDEIDSIRESELHNGQIDVVNLNTSHDIEGQLEQFSESQPSVNSVQPEESSHLEQEPKDELVLIEQPSIEVKGEQNLTEVKDGPDVKVLLVKKKRCKKQKMDKSQHLKLQDEIVKPTSQIKKAKKSNTPSKPVPKKKEKAKSKKLVHLGPQENKKKGSKKQLLQKSKTSLFKDQEDADVGKVLIASQSDSVPQLKQKIQKHKKGKVTESSSGHIKALNLSSDIKVINMIEQAPEDKTLKRKLVKQKGLAKKRKSQETQDLAKKRKSQDTREQDPPRPKKKKQDKTPEALSQKKAKVKKGTENELSTEIHKLVKQEEKEPKSQDQIKQQALLLLKGHKQPQLKVHKLDAKTTGLEQPSQPKSQLKEAYDQETTVVKKKGGKQNKAMQTASQKKKKTKTVKRKSKQNQKDLSNFEEAPFDSGVNSAPSHTKSKIQRKRKAPTKIDQEIALSPPFSRLIIGCHDCGTKFSEVSALQEHMASMHSENGLVQSSISCDVSDVSNNPAMKCLSDEVMLKNKVQPRSFEVQVSADWDVETEMREIGLGDVHRLSFPALSSSPSFQMTSTFIEGEDNINQDSQSGHLETVCEISTETGQSFTQESSTETETSYIQSTDKKTAEVESVIDSQKSLDIKEELPSDVNLVMVEDQNEEDHISTQVNSLSNASQECSGEREDESSNSEQSQNQLAFENSNLMSTSNSTSDLTEEPLIKQEENEILIQRIGNPTKTSMTRSRKGRGGRGRGKRQLGKRSAVENRGMKDHLNEKEECQVVFELYSLTDSCEEKIKGRDKQKETSNTTTAQVQSAMEESPEDQVIFELQSVPTRDVDVRKGEDSLIEISGQVKKGKSSGMKDMMRKQSNPQPETEGLSSIGTSTDVKIEASTSNPSTNDSPLSERELLQGVQVFLVKAEDHEQHVIRGKQHMQIHQATGLDGIPSGSSDASQSAGKQCIFYPVKEEEGEMLVEPPLGAQSGLDECEEVGVGCTQMDMDHHLYSSAEEGDVGSELENTQGFLEFLSQSSDTEDMDNFSSEPEAESHIMSCYHGIHSNRVTQPTQLHEISRGSKSIADSRTDHNEEARKEHRKPIDYFIQYFSWDTWKEIAECTGQVSKLPESVTEKEVAQFVGIHIAMGTLKFPTVKLYWEDCTRVPLIADAMSANRFTELTSKLRLAPPRDPRPTNLDEECGQKSTNQFGTSVETSRQIPVPGEKSTVSTTSLLCGYQDAQTSTGNLESKMDPLWKVQALVNRVQEGCHTLRKHGNHGVDQYPLPFQRHPTHSLHHTVMISVTGLVMDFNLCMNDSNREEVVEKMVSQEKGDKQGMIFLCKPELSTPSMLEHLLEAGVRSAGKVGGARGQIGDEFMTSDGKLKLFRCHHGFILSAVMKERSRSTSLVSGFERAIKAANLNRDLRSLYRTPCTSQSASAWPLSVLWDLIDLALVNSWLQYKEDHKHAMEPLSLMAFRLEVSKTLILSRSADAQESSAPYPPAPKQPLPNTSASPSDDFETPLPDATTRYDGLGHWPEQLGEGEEARCRFGGCEQKSRVRCLKCCVFLCISRNHNCFLKFHSQGAA